MTLPAPVIKAVCDASTKAAFKALAERKGLTEMHLLRALVAQVLMSETGVPPVAPPDRPIRGKLDVRMVEEEVEIVRKIVASEGVSAPRWVRMLVRRRLDREVIPFNPQEFEVLSRILAVEGALNRSLYVLVAHVRAGGVWTPEREQIESLSPVVSALRQQVMDSMNRTRSRYDAD